jgi:hypothetical protein
MFQTSVVRTCISQAPAHVVRGASRRLSWLLSCLVACSMVVPPALAQVPGDPLRYLGQQTLPRGLALDGVPIGGLSGLDYDGAGTFHAISDDRSQYGPARFYSLTLDLTRFRRSNVAGMDGVRFTATHVMRNLLGAPWPKWGVDPEGIRFDPKTGRLLWVDEGQRSAARVLRPALREMAGDGTAVRDIALPAPFMPGGSSAGTDPSDRGIRDNLSLESLAIEPARRRVWIANENALLQDGPAATARDASPVRVQSFDLDSGKAGPAHVYIVEPVVMPPLPGLFATNGLTALVALGSHAERSADARAADTADDPAEGSVFVAIERSFTAPFGVSVRLYLVSTRGATDVSTLPALAGRALQPMRKRLLLDLATLVNDDGSTLAVDNIEGISWGPASPTGRPTLILVSDNNFSNTQVTQFIALEVVGDLHAIANAAPP